MHIRSAFASLALVATVRGTTYNIAVAQHGLTYTPNTTYASVGDTVIFSFYPSDHNVVQGPFSTPCQDGDGSGIYSGFIPSSSGAANSTFQITINDTNSIWFFCSQRGGGVHCTKGMVGVINPPHCAEETLALYAAAASHVGNTTYTEPGQVQGGIVINAVEDNEIV